MNKFIEAKAAMPAPVKDTKAYNYQYATLSQVKEIVDKACADHGIGYIQYQEDGHLYTRVLDLESNETIVVDCRKLSDGNDQARGSSETYQRRYALLTVFGLAPEDDDGAAASKPNNDALKAAKLRLWNAIKAYAAEHNGDADALLEGVRKRDGYAEEPAYLNEVAYEFETAG